LGEFELGSNQKRGNNWNLTPIKKIPSIRIGGLRNWESLKTSILGAFKGRRWNSE